MAIEIRTFRNDDTAALCSVWNAHHGLRPQSIINPLQFELSVLAKPYFLSQELLLAIDDRRPVGLLHLGKSGSLDNYDAGQPPDVVAAFCIEPRGDEEAIAQQLLTVAQLQLQARGATQLATKSLPPDTPFYTGLGFGDSLIGVSSLDQRVYSWLSSFGFSPKRATTLWELEVPNFQPPTDRVQIQIRRTAHVVGLLDEPQLSWWQACVLGHTEPSGFQLTMRGDGRVVQEILVWVVGNELSSGPESIAWLWPLELKEGSEAADYAIFLLAESIRQLAEERVDILRTASDSANSQCSKILTRIGFRSIESGVVLEKRFDQA